MLGFKLGKKLPRWPRSSCFDILQTLADSFFFIRLGGNVKQPLIGGGVLNNCRCFPIHRKDHRALRLLELLDEVGGLAAERRQRY